MWVIPSFKEVGHLEIGCYITNAMVAYVECTGFSGSNVVYWLVNLPYFLIYLPIITWVPIIYLFWRITQRFNKRPNNRNH
mgnify:CR=1 FL=1